MYSILISLMLAVPYVNAIPMPLRHVLAQDPDNAADRERHKKFKDSMALANTQITNMKTVLQNPKDPRIAQAFGPNANHAEISRVVNTLDTGKFKVETMNYNDLKVVRQGVVDGGVPVKADGSKEPALFGHSFHISDNKWQAGTIIHEATHQLANTGDHVDRATGNIVPGDQTYNEATMIKGGGYAESPSVRGEKYEKMIKAATNTHQNADSYRHFASLCSRSLFKRALLADDPVEYYLAKRSQCNLPKDYLAKKAAAKNAAAKTTTASPATTKGKVSTAKSTGAKGVKSQMGAAKSTKAGKATTGKSTGAKAGKDIKAAKSVKTIKSTTGRKTIAGAKKTTKSATGRKSVAGAKKTTKSAAARKTTKAAAGRKTATGAKKTTKSVAGRKTAAGGKKTTKSAAVRKTAAGAKKTTKSAAGRKSVAGAKKTTKSTAGRKTTKAATSRKAATGAKKMTQSVAGAKKTTKSAAGAKKTTMSAATRKTAKPAAGRKMATGAKKTTKSVAGGKKTTKSAVGHKTAAGAKKTTKAAAGRKSVAGAKKTTKSAAARKTTSGAKKTTSGAKKTTKSTAGRKAVAGAKKTTKSTAGAKKATKATAGRKTVAGAKKTTKSAAPRKTTTGARKTTKAAAARNTTSGAKGTTFSNKPKGATSKAAKPVASKGKQTAASPKRVTKAASRPTAKVAPKAAVKVASPKKGKKSRRDLESIFGRLDGSHILCYTSTLISFGGKINHAINRGRGPYVFKVNGEVYHQHGSLIPEEGDAPSYAQLYIYDAREATPIRQNHGANRDLRPGILNDIHDSLLSYNHIARAYKTAKERLLEVPAGNNVTWRLQLHHGTDRRTYNLPIEGGDSIAVLIPNQPPPGPDPEDPNRRQQTKRDIVVHLRQPPNGTSPFRRIDQNSGAYDPMYYTLLFPQGELGWHWGLKLKDTPDPLSTRRQPEEANANANDATRTSLTRSNYYAYRLHERPQDSNILLGGGKLLQQYIADAWATIEQSRLNWIYHNQDTIRAEQYSAVADAAEAGGNPAAMGQRIILPATHTGSPRDMRRKCQDSLAIASWYGAEDLFITMTANPNWKEIQDILKPGQTAADVPQEVSRVFHLKVRKLLNDITKNGIFGRTVAHVYTIEFQKRGLPHMHLLVWLEPEFKPRTPSAVDKFVCAEIPDPAEFPELYEIVTRVMLHGPCGQHKPNAPCMVANRCSKGFPKPIQQDTHLQESGYPLYRRRENGHTFERGGFTYTNQWVVPYNPYLTRKYNCHINVEICSSIRAIKYIHKYIYKGHDRITVEAVVDEIKSFIDARWISAHEAVWRIFEFPMHAESPSIELLAVHEPNEQSVVYRPDQAAEEILENARNHPTTLMGFFKYYDDHPDEEKYLYSHFPHHFVWKKNILPWRWAKRQRGFALGRMPFVSPRVGEKFYIRLLLTVVPGPKSFEDLRTVDGVLHPNFKAACLARGLLEDDTEWREALRDACGLQGHTGSQLRSLFVTILLHCHPTKPEELWDNFRIHICDDLQRNLQKNHNRPEATEDDAYDYGLFLIDLLLNKNGKSLETDFPMLPMWRQEWANHGLHANHFVREQLAFEPVQQAEEAIATIAKMNQQQLSAYNKVIESVNNQQGRVFFLNGAGGTGKTFVYSAISKTIRGNSKIVLCVASSGIAALLLDGGITAHSCFSIPLDITEGSSCSITKRHLKAAMIQQAVAVIWDEAPMQHKYCMEAVDRTCRDIRDNDQPFGGMTMIFGGDFRQILPVVLKGRREEVVDACLKRSSLWNNIEVLHLVQNMRLGRSPEDQVYGEHILQLGEGKNTDDQTCLTQLPANSCLHGDINSLITSVYPNLNANLGPNYFTDRTILSTRNEDVDSINENVLGKFPGEQHTLFGINDIVEDDLNADAAGAVALRHQRQEVVPVAEVQIDEEAENMDPDQAAFEELDAIFDGEQENVVAEENVPVQQAGRYEGDPAYSPEFLASLKVNGMPHSDLRLKTGVPVMLLRNLDPANGLCNGTRLIIRTIRRRVLEATIISGSNAGKTVLIPRITLYSKKEDFGFILSRRQFPIRLAFSMTINKSQGQSVSNVGVDLRTPVFTHGQLYVAMSRVTSANGVKFLLPPDSENNMTQNVVYQEVLL